MLKTFAIALITSVMTVSTVFGQGLNSKKDSGLLMLVNSEHRVDMYFDPERVQYKDTYYYLREEAACALEEMLNDMQKELGEVPMIVSTYRSYEKQTSVYNADVNGLVAKGAEIADAIKATGRYIALPGASEHHTALAVDLSNDGSLEEDFIETQAGHWLSIHSHEYGFVVRYPKEKEEYTGIGYEPWHIRYVGKPHSDIMYNNNWCLEEYIDNIKEAGKFVYSDEYGLWNVYYADDLDDEYLDVVDVSNTNEGGYIITTCKKRAIILTRADRLNDKEILREKLIARLEK